MRWHRADNRQATEDDVNELGPQVQEVFEHQLRLKYMTQLMAEEGYTLPQISTAREYVNDRQHNLLLKSV